MQIAVLGIGKMGKNIAEKLMIAGHEVIVWNRSREVLEKMRVEKASYIVQQKLKIVHLLDELRDTLVKPRIIWLMLPAGETTDDVLQQLQESIVDHGDIVIDGGNSFFEDTQKRYEVFGTKGIKYLGIGVSGGMQGLENGYTLMVGGDKSAYDYMKVILDSIVKPNAGHKFFGEGGAGHFVKMVQNGVEYGMMQAIAEGFGVLAKSDYKLNLVDIGNTWQRGSSVASFLVYTGVVALLKDPQLAQFDGYIDAKGEGQWTIDTAEKFKVPAPVITEAVEFRKKSQYDKGVQETFVAKMVAALRHEYGGYETHKEKAEEKKSQA
ncbi:MAG TPA: NADP-dependent phosphogluconate dehydrogenase [Candidatus Sulfotelmatobacter sp.]|jgi:6-phosphogluconate dehydrogenase|nr:NADP-dependent phosphogluconate dehydrogenase [Candidatus Sulfotelmatobacter sp.]